MVFLSAMITFNVICRLQTCVEGGLTIHINQQKLFMKNVPLLFFVAVTFLFSTSLNCIAQSPSDSVKHYMQQYYQFSRQYPQEKVYLHFDNTAYYLGETIWFKAYVVNAEQNQLTNISRVLYVELLNPEGGVVETKKLKIENGQCHGQFQLKDSLFAGYYEVRAYTRYMLNFCREDFTDYIGDPKTKDIYSYTPPYSEGWRIYFHHYYIDNTVNSGIFSRVFPVYGRPQVVGDYATKTMRERPRINKETIFKEEQKPALSLLFYPEGGQLIKGNPGRIAFIATNSQGEQVDVTGNVVDQHNQAIDTIKCIHTGMGVFQFTPNGSKYTAKVWYKSQAFTFDIPMGIEKGCTMLVNNLQTDNLYLRIQGTPKDTMQTLGLSVTCRGKIGFFGTVTLSDNKPMEVSIPKTKLTTGVNQITLFSTRGEVVSQRLIFVNKGEYQQASLTVSGKKTTYSPYERIELGFQLQDTAATAKNNSFSISVRDAATQDLTYHTDNILTNLLLSSELKGYIADPAYYFESNDDTHRKALDVLLMTQGWCRYDWKQMACIDTFMLKEPVEKGILIDGTLRKHNVIDSYKFDDRKKPDRDKMSELSHKRVKNATIKMQVTQPDSTEREGSCTTATNGSFSLLAGEWYGTAELMMHITNMPQLKERFSSNEYVFSLNRNFSPTPKYPFSYYETNFPYRERDTLSMGNNQRLKTAIKDQKIDEVTVTAKQIKRKKIDYRYPNFTIDIYKAMDISQDQYNLKFYFFEGLCYIILKYLHIGDVSLVFVEEDGEYMIGRPTLKMEYDSIKVYTDLATRMRYAKHNNGYTYVPGVVFMGVKSKQAPRSFKFNGIRFTTLQGYTQPAEFYHPDYSKTPLPELKDYRRTLYWNPDVKTDSTGRATVQFYNNSTCKQINISAEGVTSNGIPVVGKE